MSLQMRCVSMKKEPMPKYIGDDEYDDFETWEKLHFQPDEDKSENESLAAIRSALKYLEKIAPHIKWRIDIEESDDFNINWHCVVVPDNQLREAEWIMKHYLNGDDLKNYSPMDQFPEIYVPAKGGKILHPDIQKFYDLCQRLGDIIENNLNSQSSLFSNKQSDSDIENKLESLLDILAQIYLLGRKLPLHIDIGWWGYNTHYDPKTDPYEYQDCLGLTEDLNIFYYIDPPFSENNVREGCLSEMVASIYFELFEPAVSDFLSDDLNDVVSAVNEWSLNFKNTDILTVLPVLDAVLSKIGNRR